MDTRHANTTIVVYSILNGITAFLLFLIALAVTFLTPFVTTMILASGNVTIPPGVSALALQQLATGAGIIAGILLFMFAAFFLALARDLWRRRTWARYAQLVISVPQLFSFPIGTLIGAFGIYAFGFDAEVRSQFGVRSAVETAKPVRRKK